MNIIQELSKNSVNEDKRSTMAIRLSILIAVTMIGTLLFLFSEIDLEQWTYEKEHIGDYDVVLFHFDKSIWEHLKNDPDIKTLGLTVVEKIEGLPFFRPNIELQLERPELFPEKNNRLVQGRQPTTPKELMVSKTFLQENSSYSLGNSIGLQGKTYTICGVFEDLLRSFDTKYLFVGVLPSTLDHLDFARYETIYATIWFQSERDTYRKMQKILSDLGQNEVELLQKNGLVYNTSYLEGKFIFRPIFRPSQEFIERWSFRSIILGIMLLLFVVMIYNAFNVWNNRDLKEIGLLKSCGMTQKQVKQLVLSKAIRLTLQPLLLGLITSYLFANFLTLLLWINEKRFHLHIGDRPYSTRSFHLITPNPLVFIFLIAMALLCVFLAALKPAKKSSRLSVIDTIKNIDPKEQKLRLKKVSYGSNICRNLAKEYTTSYRHTYNGLAFAMALAAMLLTFVLIAQSHRSLAEKYDKPDRPYTITVSFSRIDAYPQEMIEKIKQVPGIKSFHLFSFYEFRYSNKQNPSFLSDELKNAIQDPKSYRNSPRNISIYGLEDLDFEKLLAGKNLLQSTVVAPRFFLLDKTAINPRNAYKLRHYISLADSQTSVLHIVNPSTNKNIDLKIMGRVDSFPYDLRPIWPEQISLFTSMSEFQRLIIENHWINEDNPLNYMLKVEAPLAELKEITTEVKNIVYEYIPQNDVYINNRLSEMANQIEQSQNELALTLSAQILFIIIGLSNAYNSFHANLKSSERDFALLRSVGMTEKQIKSMLQYEGLFLIQRVFFYYIILYIGGILVFAYKKWIRFTPWQLAANLNYWILSLFFLISCLGIILAIESGKRRVLRQRLLDTLQDRTY